MRTEKFDPRVIVRWSARLSGALLFLFWGAFFVEHLSWFFGSVLTPPASVWLLQAVHLVLLLSFVLAWKWELGGSLLIVGSAALFLAFAAGANFPWLFTLTLVPAALFWLSWWLSERTTATPTAMGGTL